MATTPGAVTVPATSMEVSASSTTVRENVSLPWLVNDNLGFRRWDHRHQRAAQEYGQTNKLLHNLFSNTLMHYPTGERDIGGDSKDPVGSSRQLWRFSVKRTASAAYAGGKG